jgi:hypothetical protein
MFFLLYKTSLWRKVTFTFRLNTSRSFPDSWLITGFVTRLTRLMPLVEHELPEHLGSTSVVVGGRGMDIVLIEPLTLTCNSWCFMNGDILLFLQYQYSRQVHHVLLHVLYKSLTNQQTLYFTVASVLLLSFYFLISANKTQTDNKSHVHEYEFTKSSNLAEGQKTNHMTFNVLSVILIHVIHDVLVGFVLLDLMFYV